jgi:hypothetical protein
METEKKFLLLMLNISMFIIIFKLNPFMALPFSFDKLFIVLGLFSLTLYNKINKIRILSKSVIFLLLFIIYGSLISLNYDFTINHQVYRIALFVFESLTLSFLMIGAYTRIFKKNLNYILKVCFYCISIQSVFIILSFVFPFIFIFLDNLAPIEGTNFDEDSFRIFRGLSNSSGAAHSIVMAIGVVLALFLFYTEKNKIYIFSIILLFLAASINGRSGVVIIILTTISYILITMNRRQMVAPIVLSLTFFFTSQIAINYFFSFNKREKEIFFWYSEAYSVFESKNENESSFVKTFDENHILLPETSAETIFGAGYDPDNYSMNKGSDSGIIKNIFSFGIILSATFYFLLVMKIYKSGKNMGTSHLFLSLSLVMILLIGEYKEPFLVKTFLAKLIFIVIIGRNHLSNDKLFL